MAAELAKGRIAGAGLDAFGQEPLPADDPLFGLLNVALASHSAGPTRDDGAARVRDASDSRRRVARGGRPLRAVPGPAGGAG